MPKKPTIKKDLVVFCFKCEHRLYLTGNNKRLVELIRELPETDCPNCGEEGYRNWMVAGSGNYEVDNA